MKNRLWLFWVILSLALAGYLLHLLLIKDDKSELLIGESTYGHYQIELSCSSCHTDPFGGKEMLQNACLNCHEQELKEAFDSHPKKKFTDPRNADLISILDARYCIAKSIVWSTYLHPLSPLTDEQFLLGLGQVINLANTYGSTFSSGALIFGGGDSGDQQRQLIQNLMEKGLEI